MSSQKDQPGDGDASEATNIVLTGFMGTGKTTVGRLLAARLGYEFVDTDALIEHRHGPVPQIFADRGERAFRDIESEVAGELGDRRGLVIATGGAMMLDDENAVALARNGRVFCLTASPHEVLSRVTSADGTVDRPLLAGPDPLRAILGLLAERAERYARFTQIATSGRSPEAIAAEIAVLVDAAQ